ncbi:MAG: HEAT repeat domain-containing protein, partial [Candidatus Dormibacteria bacterium]
GRALASIDEPAARGHGANAIAHGLLDRRLSPGVVQEVLLLADDASGDLVAALMDCAPLDSGYLRVALEVIGYRHDRLLFDASVHFLDTDDPEAKAAALRMCSLMGRVDRASHLAVQEACEHPIEFVRVQAVRVAAMLPATIAVQALWPRLGDESWWVRKRAAESLAALGRSGQRALRRAALQHPDRFGRDMAAQILRDSGLGGQPAPEVPITLRRVS